MPTITEDELNRLEHLIGKASNLPWANTDTAKELLNVQPDDWWKIYALNGPEEKRCPYHVVCSMSQRATEEEMTAARKAYFYPDGDHIMRDPGKSGDNARYIAAACNAVPALVAEVRRLRAWQSVDKRTIAAFADGNKELLERLREIGQENAALCNKVQAWEWWDEVDHLYDDVVWSFELRQCAIDELYATLTAAREAVHADRE